MKTIKILFLLVILFTQTIFANSSFSKSNITKPKLRALTGNYVTYTPISQTVSTNSNTEVSVTVYAQCFGSSSGNVNINPTSVAWDDGLKSISFNNYSSGFLSPGQSCKITFKFKKTVTSNYSFQYKFYTNGSGQNDVTIDININYNYVAAPSPPSSRCTLPEVPNFHEEGVQATSIKLNWDVVPGAFNYDISYAPEVNGLYGSPIIHIYTTQNSVTITGLSPNTEYLTGVVANCSNGDRGYFGAGFEFTTLNACYDDLTIPINVTTGTDRKQAANTIIASNTISSNAGAIYHAGTSVTLTNGFNAIAGSSFHAYIAGCTDTFVQKKKSSKQEIEIQKDEKNYLTLYPNPTNGIFTIDFGFDNKNEININIYDIQGKEVYYSSTKGAAFYVSLPNLPAGVYVVKLKGNNYNETMKFIKE